jgi:hypothetical protein
MLQYFISLGKIIPKTLKIKITKVVGNAFTECGALLILTTLICLSTTATTCFLYFENAKIVTKTVEHYEAVLELREAKSEKELQILRETLNAEYQREYENYQHIINTYKAIVIDVQTHKTN